MLRKPIFKIVNLYHDHPFSVATAEMLIKKIRSPKNPVYQKICAVELANKLNTLASNFYASQTLQKAGRRIAKFKRTTRGGPFDMVVRELRTIWIEDIVGVQFHRGKLRTNSFDMRCFISQCLQCMGLDCFRDETLKKYFQRLKRNDLPKQRRGRRPI